MNKRFQGELKWIEPKLIIDSTQHNKIESFFVRLGVIFNDIQSLIVFEKMLEENYEEPKKGEKSVHAGTYAGLKVYIQKSIASTIHEFFSFLKENLDLFETDEFKSFSLEIPKTDLDIWNNIISASKNDLKKVSEFLDAILKIRHNIGFHFDHSGKNIWSAFISRFFRKDKNEKNDFAYYSLTDDILTTRFYFSDAAVEEILYLNAGKQKGEILMDNEAWKAYQVLIIDTVVTMLKTISVLLKKHIQIQRNRPK